MSDVNLLTARLERRAPASSHDIDDLISRSKIEFPPDYLEFMRQSDGAEGPIGNERYLVLWSTKNIIELNEQYHVDEFAPQLLVFGSDGGGEAFAFDRRTKPATIVRVPFIGFDEAVIYGSRFDDFLVKISKE